MISEVRGDGPHAEHVLHLRIVLAEEITQAGRAVLAAQRLIQRPGPERQFCPPGLPDTGIADPQVAGQLRVCRGR